MLSPHQTKLSSLVLPTAIHTGDAGDHYYFAANVLYALIDWIKYVSNPKFVTVWLPLGASVWASAKLLCQSRWSCKLRTENTHTCMYKWLYPPSMTLHSKLSHDKWLRETFERVLWVQDNRHASAEHVSHVSLFTQVTLLKSEHFLAKRSPGTPSHACDCIIYGCEFRLLYYSYENFCLRMPTENKMNVPLFACLVCFGGLKELYALSSATKLSTLKSKYQPMKPLLSRNIVLPLHNRWGESSGIVFITIPLSGYGTINGVRLVICYEVFCSASGHHSECWLELVSLF